MSVNTSAGVGSTTLSAHDVRKAFGHVQALDGASFELLGDEIHALVGDNGAGKSTLIKILSGVLQPDTGSIEVQGRSVTFTDPRAAQGAGIETVYQDLALAADLDAAENVFLGREVLRTGVLGRLGFIDRPAMRTTTEEHLHDLGIDLPSVKAPVLTLSGGQRQAVAVARAAVWGRRVLILDEPTAALSPKQADLVLDMVRRARDEKGLAVLLISHVLPHVFKVADRITVLRQGRDVLTTRASAVDTEELIWAMTGGTESLRKDRRGDRE